MSKRDDPYFMPNYFVDKAKAQVNDGTPRTKKFWMVLLIPKGKYKGWHEMFYAQKPKYEIWELRKRLFRIEHFPSGELIVSTLDLDFRQAVEFAAMTFPQKTKWLKKPV